MTTLIWRILRAPRRSGGTGRRAGLKIRFWRQSASSILAFGTKFMVLPRYACAQAVQIADEEIIRHSNRRSEALPMGTTIAAMRLLGDNEFEIAWVGDSRVYLWNGALKQISQDHSYVQELIDQGAITSEQARTHPHRNVVTQALGVTDPQSLRVETVRGEFGPGMQILLCSDGLTEEVSDAEIAALISRNELSAQECVDHLIVAALDGGGSDNVTVILVRNR